MSPFLDSGILKGKLKYHEKLAPYVAYGIGGPAEYLIFPENEEDILFVLDQCAQKHLPITVLGSGSNILVRDGGIPGVVLYLGASLGGAVQILEEDAEGFLKIRVPCTLSKAELLDWSLERGYSGLEFSAGIPGTMGGAIYMNAGTKWGAYSDVVESVRFYHSNKGVYEKTCVELGFKYRGHGESVMDSGTVVLSVDLKLKKVSQPESSRKHVDQILKERGSKQPLELSNCGSVFKNPEGTLGAGRLIEACGLKGTQQGQAQISLQHANFILNRGSATAQDVETLIQLIQKTVLEKFSIHLEPEVIILGCVLNS